MINDVGTSVPTNVSRENPHIVQFNENSRVRLECEATGTEGVRSREILVARRAWIVLFEPFSEFRVENGTGSFYPYIEVLNVMFCSMEVVHGPYSDTVYFSFDGDRDDFGFDLGEGRIEVPNFDPMVTLSATLSCFGDEAFEAPSAVETRVRMP